jgi:glycosyltransferase involved in cell wall biosynthesis
MELVSIIIPCYNHAMFIEETLRSALASTYSPIEIIIINDGSKDNSEEIALKYSREFPNIFYISQTNQGPAAARNNGIRSAKGKYILPLDADDRISNDYIEKAVTVLQKDKTIKVVYCNAEFFGEKKQLWKLPNFSPERLARENMIFSTAMYRKSDWEKAGGYDERMTWGWEDWEYWISLLKDGGDVVRLPITGFFYRVRKGSRRKSTNREAKRKTVALINEKHLDFEKKYLHGPLLINRSWSATINKIANFTHRIWH